LLRDKEERLLPSYRLSQLGPSDDPNFLVFERPRYYTSSGNAAQDVPRSGDESLPQSGTAHAEMQMPKNIVICCDTNYEGNKGGSNVLKLYLTLTQCLGTQVAYFDPGLDNVKKIEMPAAVSQVVDLASFASAVTPACVQETA
jgi:hypothetical protein